MPICRKNTGTSRCVTGASSRADPPGGRAARERDAGDERADDRRELRRVRELGDRERERERDRDERARERL